MSLVDTRSTGHPVTSIPPDSAPSADTPTVEPTMVRVSVLGGNTQMDVALPAGVPIAALMTDLIAHVESRSPRRSRSDDPDGDAASEGSRPDDHRHRWTLSHIGRHPLPLERSLAECGVRHGDLLVISRLRTGEAPVLYDDVVDAVARLNESHFANWSARAARILGFSATILASLVAAVSLCGMRAQHSDWWPAIPAALAAVALITASTIVARHRRDGATAAALSAAAIPPAFAAGMLGVPGTFGSAGVSLGFASALVCAVISYRCSAAGPVIHSAVITASILGGCACVADLLLTAPGGDVAAVTAVVGLVVIGLAPRLTIVLAKLPLPPVPTAGAPIDIDDAEPPPTIEGIGAIGAIALPKTDALERRSYLANAYLTGIVAGSTVITAVAAVVTATPWAGIDWRSMSLAMIVAVVLCLRGRSHSDLAQAATLVTGGCLTLAAIVASWALGPGMWPLAGFAVGVLAMIAAMIGGVVAPRHAFSPVMRRLAELTEYALIAVIVPLLAWILDLYQTVRNL
ncbi:type VII secretion integral membrane protein EccD [Gordonia oleivorans]|uniref:type VII secretion integral membrane protein EccD n=2 Tax=Gordonia TaxID=2053 RepID=UPI003CCD39C0